MEGTKACHVSQSLQRSVAAASQDASDSSAAGLGLVSEVSLYLKDALTLVSAVVGLANCSVSLGGSFCAFFVSAVSLSEVSLTRSAGTACLYKANSIQELMF